jgi:hypothetical protein
VTCDKTPEIETKQGRFARYEEELGISLGLQKKKNVGKNKTHVESQARSKKNKRNSMKPQKLFKNALKFRTPAEIGRIVAPQIGGIHTNAHHHKNPNLHEKKEENKA